MWSIESEGPPTTGMTQVLESQEKELSELDAEARALLAGEIAAINAQAAKMGLAFVIVQ